MILTEEERLHRLARRLRRMGFKRADSDRKEKWPMDEPTPKNRLKFNLDSGYPVEVEYDRGGRDHFGFHSLAISSTGYRSYHFDAFGLGTPMKTILDRAKEVAEMLAAEYRQEWETSHLLLTLPDYLKGINRWDYKRTFRLFHREKHLFSPDLVAPGPGEACKIVGWPISECWVREYTLRGGWKDITPRKIKGKEK